jgi:hypothetical protein
MQSLSPSGLNLSNESVVGSEGGSSDEQIAWFDTLESFDSVHQSQSLSSQPHLLASASDSSTSSTVKRILLGRLISTNSEVHVYG